MLLGLAKSRYCLTFLRSFYDEIILVTRLQGISTELLDLVVTHAKAQAAEAVYLHVVTYNNAAIAFYRRNHFSELSLLRGFYHIA